MAHASAKLRPVSWSVGISFCLLLLTFALAGCGSDDSNDNQQPVQYRAVLGGGQETPPVQSTGSGNSTVEISPDRTQFSVTLNTFGIPIQNITAAHIHVGGVGQAPANNIIFPLFSNAGGAVFPGAGNNGTLNLTLNQTNFTPAAGINTFAEALNAIENGNTYVNVHTQANAGGELRGQIGPVQLTGNLTGANVVPAVVTPGTATTTLRVDPTHSKLDVGVITQNLVTQNINGITIHSGSAGQNGDPLFTLYNRQAYGTFPANGMFNTSLTAQNFTPGGGLTTFQEAVNAILSGNAYIAISTDQNPNGEVRSQFGP